jgi:GDPmannose 4,6-dehydratase
MKKALITGITGQDGSYLAEYLLSIGYEVHGIKRRSSTFNTNRIDHIYQDPHILSSNLYLYYGDLLDAGNLIQLIYDIIPDEIYHFGAQSHVRVSFDMPEYTGDVTALGTTRILEAVRRSGGKSKFYQASSSELFGSAKPPQNELTHFVPKSPYAIAKLYAYWMTVNYRNAYNLFACNGILFNHESPRRGETFVTRKITRAISSILAGQQKKLFLGNIDAKRDWGFAPEYVMMTWLMLQQDTAEDYAIGTGESHSVRDFIETALNYCGIEIEWQGLGISEKGYIKSLIPEYSDNLKSGDVIIEIDSRYFRPTEVDYLMADISKAKNILGWEPKVKFNELVKIMMDYDLKLFGVKEPGEGEKIMKKYGFNWTKNISFETRH